MVHTPCCAINTSLPPPTPLCLNNIHESSMGSMTKLESNSQSQHKDYQGLGQVGIIGAARDQGDQVVLGFPSLDCTQQETIRPPKNKALITFFFISNGITLSPFALKSSLNCVLLCSNLLQVCFVFHQPYGFFSNFFHTQASCFEVCFKFFVLCAPCFKF